jgi:hypothetical protein
MSVKSVGLDSSGMIHACKRYFVPKSVRKGIQIARLAETYHILTYIFNLRAVFIYGA